MYIIVQTYPYFASLDDFWLGMIANGNHVFQSVYEGDPGTSVFYMWADGEPGSVDIAVVVSHHEMYGMNDSELAVESRTVLCQTTPPAGEGTVTLSGVKG